MIKQLILNIIHFLSPKNYKIRDIKIFEDGTQRTEYYFGSKVYVHIGNFPPNFSNITRKFPIYKAVCDENDVTDIIKKHTGPLNSFEPCTSYIFYKTVYKFKFKFEDFGFKFIYEPIFIRGEPKDIRVTNILRQESTFGAK